MRITVALPKLITDEVVEIHGHSNDIQRGYI